MLTKWVRQAWDDFYQYDSESICQVFRNVGLALPINGSRDNEIKIKDLLRIKVGNWQDWAPSQGVTQPEDENDLNQSSNQLPVSTSQIDTVMVNASLKEVEDRACDPDEEVESSESEDE